MIRGYCRVSTQEQSSGWSLSGQQYRLVAAVPGMWSWYSEVASGSGDWLKRPKLVQMMMADLRPGDTILVVKFDRLARNARSLLDICDRADHIGASIRSLDEHVDTRTPQGRLFRTMLAGFAEFERDMIVDRTKQGLAAARAAGVKLGRPRVVNQDLCRSLVAQGKTVRGIAKQLGVHPSSVSRALRV